MKRRQIINSKIFDLLGSQLQERDTRFEIDRDENEIPYIDIVDELLTEYWDRLTLEMQDQDYKLYNKVYNNEEIKHNYYETKQSILYNFLKSFEERNNYIFDFSLYR